MNTTAILLATYNGEKYLEAFLQSLYKQSYNNFDIIVRDDGSVDNSLNILKSYMDKLNIIFIKDKLMNIGIIKNYNKILEYIEKNNYENILFADQDDIWFPNKVEIMIEQMSLYTQKYNCPLLIHCNAIITDENLNPIQQFINIHKEYNLNQMIFHPIVQMASVIINKKLLQEIYHLPSDIFMHDYYISIVNEIIGKRIFLDESLMYYRQHDSNLLGANNKTIDKLKKIFSRNYMLLSTKQIFTLEYILEKYNHRISTRKKEYLENALKIANPKIPKYKKIMIIFKYDFRTKDGQSSLVLKSLLERN